VTLDDLTRDEVAALIEARLQWDRVFDLLDRLDLMRARVNALYHFSGGNPRLVLAMYSILRSGFTDALYNQLLKLLDEVTPYYQARVNDVAPQMGRVLTEMALVGGASTASELAKRCRIPTNQLTAHLSKLESERFVRPVARGKDRRRRYYELTDRLFRLWIQMREDRTARGRLRFLVEFYQAWYAGAPGDLQSTALRVATAFWSDIDRSAVERCRDHLRTLDHLRDSIPGERNFVQWGSLVASRTNVVNLARSATLRELATEAAPYERAVSGLLAARELVATGRAAEAHGVLDRLSIQDESALFLESTLIRASAFTAGDLGWLKAMLGDQKLRVHGVMVLIVVAGHAEDYDLVRQCAAGAVRIGLGEMPAWSAITMLLATGKVGEVRALIETVAFDEPTRVALAGCFDGKADPLVGLVELLPQPSVTPERRAWLFPTADALGRGHEVVRHLSAVEISEFADRLMERAVRALATGAPIDELVAALRRCAPPRVTAAFAALREPGRRLALQMTSAYARLRDAGLLPADFPPYSTAVELRADPSIAAQLAPEVREAAELLLAAEARGATAAR
jgi:DNA-binding MarR family transcriptional regulator